jgi:hypothetical protein
MQRICGDTFILWSDLIAYESSQLYESTMNLMHHLPPRPGPRQMPLECHKGED